MKIIYIGVDPGKAGFITAFDGIDSTFYPMPTHKIPTGKKLKNGDPQMKSVFHEHGLIQTAIDIKKKYSDKKTIFRVFIEEVGGRGGWSATNNFNFGYVAGMQKMIMLFLSEDIQLVRPQKWQSYMRQGYTELKKASSTGKTMISDPKAMAEVIVRREYPEIDFRKTERASKFDDNKVDSFLLAIYGYRTDVEFRSKHL